MGFRNPIQTATAVDTGAGSAVPRVRMYATTVGPYRSGVVEWSDGLNTPATASLGSGGVSGGTNFALRGSNSQGVVAPSLELAVAGLPDGGYGSVARLTAQRLELNGGVVTGGRYPVTAYGAVGDGVTPCSDAIDQALAECPEGGEVYFPVGTWSITRPIVLTRNKALAGLHAGRWPYDTGAPCRLRADPSFVGAALVLMQDEEALTGSVGAAANGQQSGPADQCGQGIRNLTLDGYNVAGGIDGILATGLVRSVKLVDVSVRRCTGTAVHTNPYQRKNGVNYYPRGWSMTRVVADSSGNNGFALNLLNDSILVDCLSVGNTVHGFYLAGAGELQLVGCRSVYNKGGHGFWLTGGCFGNVVLQVSTDRNQLDGVHIDATGNATVTLVAPALRRDGANSNNGGGAFAGLCVTGSTCVVTVVGISTQPGVDDAGAGVLSPQYGARVLNSRSVTITGGVLWGATGSYLDGGGNTSFRPLNVVQGTGSTSAPAYTYSP